MSDGILNTTAKEAASSIRTGVAAVFGPPGREIGEYLAEKIKYHRYKSLVKIFDKIHSEFGDKPKIPPLKFFVPFCEQASLEEDDDNVIIDIWSKLLKDAINEFSSRHMIFMRLVKEMTSKEAQLLYDICYNFRGSTEDPGTWGVAEAPGFIAEASIYKFLVEWVSGGEGGAASRSSRQLKSDEHSSSSLKSFRRSLIEKFEVPGILIRHIMFAKGTRGVWPYQYADEDPHADQASPIESRYPQVSFDILRGLNIIDTVTTDEIWYENWVVTVSYCELTPLGVEFFSLCNGGPRVVARRGNYWSPEGGWQWR